jgi:glutathione peroxidase
MTFKLIVSILTLCTFNFLLMDNIAQSQTSAAVTTNNCPDLLNIKVKDINGQEVNLCKYQGKVLLIVNTASKCGFTCQYADLEKLYQKYHSQGFEILAFPSNDFLNQEPAADEQIKSFCSLNYNISFPLFAKIKVKGKEQSPLYAKLSALKGSPQWNFQKYLINREGKLIEKFAPITSPLSAKIEKSIKLELNK